MAKALGNTAEDEYKQNLSKLAEVNIWKYIFNSKIIF